MKLRDIGIGKMMKKPRTVNHINAAGLYAKRQCRHFEECHPFFPIPAMGITQILIVNIHAYAHLPAGLCILTRPAAEIQHHILASRVFHQGAVYLLVQSEDLIKALLDKQIKPELLEYPVERGAHLLH